MNLEPKVNSISDQTITNESVKESAEVKIVNKKFNLLLIFKKNKFLLIIILLLVLSSLLIRITYVYDFDTKKPISDANVMILHGVFWNGCIDEKYYKPNSYGIVFEFGLFNNTCMTTVKKDSYIINGINHKSSFLNIIYLKKLEKISVRYGCDQIYEKDGVDILGTLNEPLKSNEGPSFDTEIIKPTVSKLIDNSKIDLIVESIENTAPQENVYGYATAKIKFLGSGGIKEIDDTDLGTSYYEDFTSLNLTEPPKNGYAKEMTIGSYKQYVALLRDGKTYVKIFPIINKKYLQLLAYTFDDSLVVPHSYPDNSLAPLKSDNKITNNKSLMPGQLDFTGLIFNLPSNLFIGSKSENSMEIIETKNESGYLISSIPESYSDYLSYMRKVSALSVIDKNLPEGVSKINLSYTTEPLYRYSFYDSTQKRSYQLGNYSGSKLNLNINYILSLISNLQIQK